jgi:hypothetical protein
MRGDIMSDKKKQIDPIPEEFSSYEEAAEFWDNHDTTDYLDVSRPIEVVADFHGRYYEVEIEASVVDDLRDQARRQGVTMSSLATELLRQQLATAGRLGTAV